MIKTKKIRDAVVRYYPAVNLEDNLETAMKVMAQNNASVLVIASGEDIIGLVTVSDIMHCLSLDEDWHETRISSFMTKCEIITGSGTRNPCAQLDEELDAISAAKVMYEAGVNHLLVTGSEGKPVGVVSSLELIKLLAA